LTRTNLFFVVLIPGYQGRATDEEATYLLLNNTSLLEREAKGEEKQQRVPPDSLLTKDMRDMIK
jgi:hypothetical protein